MSEAPLGNRVAIVYPHLPHYRYGVFKELDERIADVLFITGGESRDGTIAITPPGSFRRETTVHNRWLGPFLWQAGLSRALNEFAPEAVVYLGDYAYLSTWVSAMACRLRGRRVYFWTIGWHKPDSGFRRIIRIRFYSLADKLLLYGRVAQEIGVSMGFSRERTHIVYNSYASEANAPDAPVTDELLPPEGRPVVGAVIRLSSNKGLRTVIDTVAELNRTSKFNACCLIVGEGPERERLMKRAAEVGVDLYLPGAVYSAQALAEVYRRLDVTLVPRAAGLTVLQSLNAGTPVVTLGDAHQQMPEFEAVVDGTTGTLVSSATPGAFAEACKFWLLRIAAEGESVRGAIRASASYKWHPEAQARSIIAAITSDSRTSPS